MNILQHLLIFLIRLYQRLLSPMWLTLVGPSSCCRFNPSCSQYALECVRLHGSLVGSWLALRRLARCHPWGASGDDPPPGRIEECRVPHEEFNAAVPGALSETARNRTEGICHGS